MKTKNGSGGGDQASAELSSLKVLDYLKKASEIRLQLEKIFYDGLSKKIALKVFVGEDFIPTVEIAKMI